MALTIYAMALEAFPQGTCGTALLITPGTWTVPGVNGTEIPTPVCAPNGSTNVTSGMWYAYATTQDVSVTVTTDLPQNAGTDTRVHVYQGPCSDLVCVTGDDDGGSGLSSTVKWNALAGVPYTVAFDNRWSSNGFAFEVSEGPFPPPTTLGFTSVSINTSGSALGVVDMNGDHRDDVVSVTSTNVRVHRQRPGGGFDQVDVPTPQAENSPSWSMAAGDIDGNGWTDLLYAGGGGVSFMYANDDGTAFSQVAGPEPVFSQRSNFVDIDNDGHLDAFVCHDLGPNVYYINDGDGGLTFFQGGLGDTPDGGNYGSIWIDYDNDGDIDLFLAKCQGGNSPGNINQLYRNNGDGTFTEVAAEVGLADDIQTWSAAWGDFDNDGYQDVLVGASSFANGGHRLMRNEGGVFVDVTEGSGWDTFSNTSIEHVAHDLNNDGHIDVLAGGGTIMLNNGDMTFTPVNTGVGPGPVGDLNGDGFLDVLNGGTIRMNMPNGNNWVRVNTVGVESNRNGIGARVTVTSALGTQMRDVKSGDGFRYMSSLAAHFGLGGDTEIEEIVVYWPSGRTNVLYDPAINTSHEVVEDVSTGVPVVAGQEGLRVRTGPNGTVLLVEGYPTTSPALAHIIDTSGRSVQQGPLRHGSLDISRLAPGVYILRLHAGNMAWSQRFLKH